MATTNLHLLIFQLLCSIVGGIVWNTPILKDWTIQCPPNHAVIGLASAHKCEDRLWNITCAPIDPSINFTECTWTNFLADHHANTFLQCPKNSIVAGVTSFVEDADRNFNFYCCTDESYAAHSCEYSQGLNTLKSMFSYQVPEAMYLRGWVTFHDVASHDSFFYAHTCMLSNIGPPEICPMRDVATKSPAVELAVNMTTVPLIGDTESTATSSVFLTEV